MRRTLIILAVASVTLLAGCKGKQKRQQAEAAPQEQAAGEGDGMAAKVAVGQAAPDFTVTMLDGTQHRLSDFRGKVVLLNFWATWCSYCVVELERVPQDVIARFEGQDFVFLPVSREETAETVAGFMEKRGLAFNAGLDPDRAIYSLYADKSIPRNFVIDREGNIAFASIGYESEEFEGMLGLIEGLLKK